jgi:hypothetical protein
MSPLNNTSQRAVARSSILSLFSQADKTNTLQTNTNSLARFAGSKLLFID